VGGAWAVLVLGGSRAAEEAGTADDDAEAQAWAAQEDELAAYLGRLRAAHVGPVDEAGLAGVPLALPPAGGREADGTPPAAEAVAGPDPAEPVRDLEGPEGTPPASSVTVSPEQVLREETARGPVGPGAPSSRRGPRGGRTR
jgi:hypothetical protein